MKSVSSSPQFCIAFLAVASIGLVVAGFKWFSQGENYPPQKFATVEVSAKPSAAPKSPFGIAPAPMPSPQRIDTAAANLNPKAATYPSFQGQPFAVTKTNGMFGWTSEDGRTPEAIRKLAHNDLEAERMTQENSTIRRRQLVYCNEPIAVTVQQARAAGQTVESFSLPALDGQTYDVEVTQNSVEPVIAAGSLTGHLKDRPNSVASIGFKDGYESFNIISPDDGLYLVADAREPGQVVVKEIIPGVYGTPAKISREPDYILTK